MTRQEILKNIEILFFEKSFKQVSMQDIANDLWMKKASLYYHFPSKEALIHDVLDFSFEIYMNFINHTIEIWTKDNFKQLLTEFLDFWDKEKNIFSIINQNWFRESDEINSFLEEKQKIIFETIHKAMSEKASFTKEKTFLFLSLINDVGRKNTIYRLCEIEKDKVVEEIEKLFFS